MPEFLLTTIPPTRVNDLFVKANSSLNFRWPEKSYKDPIIQGTPNIDNRFYADFYKKIGLDIVTETVMDYPYNFITEKIWRPIANGRPFIILGPYHTLDFLKSLHFKTFSSIINEEYDDIKDPELRFKAVCKTVETFVNRPLEQIVSDITSVSEILKENQIILQQLINDQLQQLRNQIKID